MTSRFIKNALLFCRFRGNRDKFVIEMNCNSSANRFLFISTFFLLTALKLSSVCSVFILCKYMHFSSIFSVLQFTTNRWKTILLQIHRATSNAYCDLFAWWVLAYFPINVQTLPNDYMVNTSQLIVKVAFSTSGVPLRFSLSVWESPTWNQLRSTYVIVI